MNEKQKEYLRTIAAMSSDCLCGGITYKTYLLNLDIIVMQLKEMESNGGTVSAVYEI